MCVQLILIKLLDMSGIYYEISNPTPSDMIGHEVSIFFTFKLYK